MNRGRPPVIFGRVAERADGPFKTFVSWRAQIAPRVFVEVFRLADENRKRGADEWCGIAYLHRGRDFQRATIANSEGLTRAMAVRLIEAKTREVLKELREVRV